MVSCGVAVYGNMRSGVPLSVYGSEGAGKESGGALIIW